MIFKPRIFISSTLSENLSVRTKIENFYSSIGAEAMLYEKNLTPSVNPMTYRRDILDADFVILIVKSQYGERTENGISGTQEEFQIALESNIPMHVYIKLASGATESQELIDKINDNHISYYYFKNDFELLTRIKQTTFTIAKEIMLKNVEDAELPSKSVFKISIKHDYDKAVELVKIVESMQKVNNLTSYDYIGSTLFHAFLSPYIEYINSQDWIFTDNKLEKLLSKMISIYSEFSQHSFDYSSIPETNRTFKSPVIGKVIVWRCSKDPTQHLTGEQYEKIIERFFKQFQEFTNYVQQRKFQIDTML